MTQLRVLTDLPEAVRQALGVRSLGQLPPLPRPPGRLSTPSPGTRAIFVVGPDAVQIPAFDTGSGMQPKVMGDERDALSTRGVRSLTTPPIPQDELSGTSGACRTNIDGKIPPSALSAAYSRPLGGVKAQVGGKPVVDTGVSVEELRRW